MPDGEPLCSSARFALDKIIRKRKGTATEPSAVGRVSTYELIKGEFLFTEYLYCVKTTQYSDLISIGDRRSPRWYAIHLPHK